MPKPAKPRDSYNGDIATLSRIARAVAADEKRDPDWRSRVVKHIYDAVKLLMQDTEDKLAKPVRASR